MDTGTGKFEQMQENAADRAMADASLQDAMKALEAKHPAHGGWFQIGEVVQIRGSFFRVKAVKPTQLILKLLPRQAEIDKSR